MYTEHTEQFAIRASSAQDCSSMASKSPKLSSTKEVIRELSSDDQPTDSLHRSSESTSVRSGKRKGSEWEILGDLEKGMSYNIKPKKYEGYLNKRKKWPLKGWHKRYFVIEQGYFTYAKTVSDISRGRTLGKFNIGIAVISANFGGMRIDA